MENKNISIANDFSKFPSGRYYGDGPFSGEKFREEYIVPALKKYDKVIINIDGVRGFSSSFLEEAFGGIIRNKYFTKEKLKEKLQIKSESKFMINYIEEIWSYINEAS